MEESEFITTNLENELYSLIKEAIELIDDHGRKIYLEEKLTEIIENELDI